MKLFFSFLKQAFAVSIFTLFLSTILESIFPHLVSSTISFDKLLQIAIFIGVCWAVVTWQTTHFERKLN